MMNIKIWLLFLTLMISVSPFAFYKIKGPFCDNVSKFGYFNNTDIDSDDLSTNEPINIDDLQTNCILEYKKINISLIMSPIQNMF